MFDNQPVFLSNFYKYLDTPKQVIKYYTCSKYTLNYFNKDDFEKWFYTPKTNNNLVQALKMRHLYPEISLLKNKHISTWNITYITDISGLYNEINVNGQQSWNKLDRQHTKDWNISNIKNWTNLVYYNPYINWSDEEIRYF